MRTFQVSDVAPERRPIPATDLSRMVAHRLEGTGGRELEAAGANLPQLVSLSDLRENATHPLLEAVHAAFAEHYPLVLSPDDVWLCIAQGFAQHVEAHEEALRARFVRHEGKVELMVIRDGFVLGSPHNDWQGCFAEWSDKIAAHIGKQRDLVVSAFSTTGPVERAASELVLMSAMKGYFDFTLITRCGIPSVTLLGTEEDWRQIRRRAEVLAEYDLGDWLAALLPVLDEFVAAAAGRADGAFWRSIYKLNDQSGGPYVTGWITTLFPYLESKKRRSVPRRFEAHAYALRWRRDLPEGRHEGTPLSAFPCGLSSAPLTWKYLGQVLPMKLHGGFVGISQDPETFAVRPAIGWAVQHAEP